MPVSEKDVKPGSAYRTKNGNIYLKMRDGSTVYLCNADFDRSDTTEWGDGSSDSQVQPISQQEVQDIILKAERQANDSILASDDDEEDEVAPQPPKGYPMMFDEQEVEIVKEALEIYMRVHLGQVRKVMQPLIDHLMPGGNTAFREFNDDTGFIFACDEAQAKVTGNPNGGPSLYNKEVSNRARVARRLLALMHPDDDHERAAVERIQKDGNYDSQRNIDEAKAKKKG